MRVYMGPYKNPFSVYCLERWWLERRYGEKFYDIEEENYTKVDNFVISFCKKIQLILNNTINKFFKERKIKIKIHDYDIWSMDSTLALIIHPMLLKLKENKHGSPIVDAEDVPEVLRPDPNRDKMYENKEIEYWEIDNTIEKRWDWVLDEIIFAFSCELDDEWEDQFYSGQADHIFVKNEETGLTEMKYGPKHTFKIDKDAMEKEWDRRKNGLRLFGKYYHGLWD